MGFPRYFTLEEASAALPEVEPLLLRLRDLRAQAAAAKAHLDALWDELHEGRPVLDDLLAAQGKMEARAAEVRSFSAGAWGRMPSASGTG